MLKNCVYQNLWIYIWAVTCDFQQCGILTCVDSDKPVQPPTKLRNAKCCSVRKNIQATSKGSDQTAHMRRLVWAFADHLFYFVGNLMSRLICYYEEILQDLR